MIPRRGSLYGFNHPRPLLSPGGGSCDRDFQELPFWTGRAGCRSSPPGLRRGRSGRIISPPWTQEGPGWSKLPSRKGARGSLISSPGLRRGRGWSNPAGPAGGLRRCRLRPNYDSIIYLTITSSRASLGTGRATCRQALQTRLIPIREVVRVPSQIPSPHAGFPSRQSRQRLLQPRGSRDHESHLHRASAVQPEH